MKGTFSAAIGALMLVTASAAQPVVSAEVEAEALVQRIRAHAVELAGLGQSSPEREVSLVSQLKSSFDITAIARFVAGPYWNGVSLADRGEFAQALAGLIVDGLVRRLGSRNDAAFDVLSYDHHSRGDTIVATRLTLRDAQVHLIDWRLRRTPAGLAAIDVVVNGRSMIVTRREQLMDELRSNGGSLPVLTASLRARVPQSR